jgi:hypothetical protein
MNVFVSKCELNIPLSAHLSHTTLSHSLSSAVMDPPKNLGSLAALAMPVSKRIVGMQLMSRAATAALSGLHGAGPPGRPEKQLQTQVRYESHVLTLSDLCPDILCLQGLHASLLKGLFQPDKGMPWTCVSRGEEEDGGKEEASSGSLCIAFNNAAQKVSIVHVHSEPGALLCVCEVDGRPTILGSVCFTPASVKRDFLPVAQALRHAVDTCSSIFPGQTAFTVLVGDFALLHEELSAVVDAAHWKPFSLSVYTPSSGTAGAMATYHVLTSDTPKALDVSMWGEPIGDPWSPLAPFASTHAPTVISVCFE